MTKVTIDRDLLERIGELMHIIAHRQDDYGVVAEYLGSLLKKAIAHPTQQGEAVEVVEVRGLQWLDTGHYRKKPPQFGYNPHDWNQLMTVAQHQRIVAALSAQQSEPERVSVPVEPPRELLMSMALRLDHGLGCPGYYDQPIFGSGVGVTHAQRLESALSDMRKVYEEVTGQGFYSPANAERYSALLASTGQEV